MNEATARRHLITARIFVIEPPTGRNRPTDSRFFAASRFVLRLSHALPAMKFLSCAARAIPEQQAQKALAALRQIDDSQDVRVLMSMRRQRHE